MRTSANSQDLRGKILRVHPNADGSVSIPAGNLFTDPEMGRPEILQWAAGTHSEFLLIRSMGQFTGVTWAQYSARPRYRPKRL